MKELKEKYIKETDDLYGGRFNESVQLAIWQFIEENFVSEEEYNKSVTFSNEMTSSMLKQSEQLAELKETATSRLTQMAADEISIQILSDQLAEAKAENSHLKDKLQVTEVELEGANAYIGTIKAENEVLSKYYGQNENKTIPFLQQQIEQLKAENEKLSAQRNNGKVVVQYLDDNNQEEYDSFQEAKEAILESFTDKDEGIHPDIESIKVLQEIYKIEVPENPDGTYGINFVSTKVSDELTQAEATDSVEKGFVARFG